MTGRWSRARVDVVMGFGTGGDDAVRRPSTIPSCWGLSSTPQRRDPLGAVEGSSRGIMRGGGESCRGITPDYDRGRRSGRGNGSRRLNDHAVA